MDILVRNVPEDVVSALNAHAQAAGLDRLTWILQEWGKLASQPIIKERYAYRVYSAGGKKGKITRHSDHLNGTGSVFSQFNQEEADIIHRAEDLMRRNGPGDRERAVALLQGTFEEVVEVSV